MNGESYRVSVTFPKLAAYGAAIFLLTVFQTSFASRVTVFGAIPALTLAFTCAAGYFDGERTGCAVGVACGFLTDAFGGTWISFLPLVYCIAGFLVGHFSVRLSQADFRAGRCFIRYLMRLSATSAAGMVVCVIYCLMAGGEASILRIIGGTALPEAAATALCGTVYWPVFRLIYRRKLTGEEY